MTRLRRVLVLVVYAGTLTLAVLFTALAFTPAVAGPAHYCRGWITYHAGQRGALTTTVPRCHLDKP